MIRLQTLGSVELESQGGEDLRAVLAQPKRLALLVYLAAARPFRVHRRDDLLALFWPDLDNARARDALNQALRFLRQALGTEALVRRGAEEVGLDRERIWCDAVAFLEALESGRAAEALELYRGPFLQGFFIEEGGGFEEWMDRERTAMREAAARGARQLAEQHAEAGALTLAIDWGRKALEFAPDDERVLRRLLRLHAKAGDRAGAFRAYETFVRRFQEDFGGEPSPETRAIVERLRGGQGFDDDLPRSPQPPQRHTDPSPEVPKDDRYPIIREIGAGGMATVYLARDVKHDRDVALKVLRAEVAEGLARQRFIREIRIASRLQHPNIVPLFDSGESDGKLFYVMPYLPGPTLRDRLATNGPFPIDEVVHILRELTGALTYAHGQGVIHRDIKPANILLIDRRAVLADFGIARAAQVARTPAEGGPRTLTQTGVSLGTPAYMAPEQVAGDSEVDHRADLYALGSVGYEMLTGRPPFAEGTSAQVLAAQLATPPRPVGELRAETPGWLASLVMWCLEKGAADRPASAQLFEQALHHARTRRGRGRASIRRGAVIAGVLVVLLGFAAAAAKLLGPMDRATAGSRFEEVAQIGVRPFTDLTRTPDLARMAETFSSDLVSELARVPLLRVRSASAIAPLRSVTPDSIRRALGVGTLIEGSVTEEGDSIRIATRIVTTLTGDEIARERWTVPRARVLILGDSLVQEMGRFVRELLGRELQSQRGRLGTASAEAWEHYQMGNTTFNEVRRLYQSGETTAAMKLLKVADSLLARAVSLDSRWSEALLAKGWLDIWRGVGSDSASIAEANVWNREAIDIAARVLQHRPGYPEAHELRGTGFLQIAINGRGDSTTLAQAERDLRFAAVPSNASQARAWFRLAMVMRWQGRPAEANVAARRAYDLDAFLEQADELLAQLCSTAFELNQVRDAEEWCTEGKRRFPEKFEFAYHLLQMMPSSRGRPHPDSAVSLYRTLVRLTPAAERAEATPGWQLMLAAALARAGLPDSARRLLAAAEASHVAPPDVDVYAAAAWVALGETGNALERLGAFLRKNPHMRQVVASHPSFAVLEHDPRFQRLVSRDRH